MIDVSTWADDDYVADTIIDFMEGKTPLPFKYKVYSLSDDMNRIEASNES